MSGNIVGFAVGRRCYAELLVIAPIYATNDRVFRKLFLSLVPENYIGRVKVFASNRKREQWNWLSDVAQIHHDCTAVFCFTQAAPDVDIDRLYGISEAVMGFL